MTTTELSMTDHVQLDVTPYDDAAPVVAALRNAYAQSTTPDAAFVWFFQLGAGEWAPTLAVGIRGEIGALTWYQGNEGFVPADGSNQEDVDYWMWSGHEAPMPPQSEVPISVVYAALEELVRTHERPTCVDWQRDLS
jgi:hypothetical protein